MSYTDPVELYTIIESVVDSIRETNVIDSSVEVSGTYTLVSDNTLANKDYVTINDVQYKVSNVSDTQFNIKTTTGLDFTNDTWKANAPYFMCEKENKAGQILNEKTKQDTYKYQKYPLFLLTRPYTDDRSNRTIGYSVDFNLHIITDTDQSYWSDDRIDTNFDPILYPLYNSFMSALPQNRWVKEKKRDKIAHTKSDLMFIDGKPFPDKMDGLTMAFNDFEVLLNTQTCATVSTKTYNLTLTAGEGGSAEPFEGTEAKNVNEIVAINATANANFNFANWLINGVVDLVNPTWVKMTNNITAIAEFMFSIITMGRPADWGWSDGITITYDPNTDIFTSDFDITTKKNTPTDTYFLGATKQYTNIADVINAINVDWIGDNSVVAEVIIDSETFYSNNHTTPLAPVNFICSGIAYFTNDYLEDNAPNWNDEGSNTYSMNIPDSKRVFDASILTDCDYEQLDLVADIATCKATSKSYFIDGANNVYIHLSDNRIPDSNVKVYTDDSNFILRGKNNYFENISFEGGNYPVRKNNDDGNQSFNGCNFKYATIGNGLDIFTDSEMYLVDCISSYNWLDGFNYHDRSVRVSVYEEKNIGRFNGWNGGESNNGSTVHEDGRIIRINCEYTNNGRNIHDIDTVISLNYGVIANTSRNTGVENSVNLRVGLSGDLTNIYIYSGNYKGGSETDIYVDSGANLYYYNYPIGDNIVVNNGTITEITDAT